MKNIKKFIKHVVLFALPVLLFFAFFMFLAVKSGELTSTPTAVENTLSGETELFGLGFRYVDFEYKHAMTAAKSADVLVFGTSRSMQLRGEFFETDSFYNAGGALPYLPQGYNFLSKLPSESLPDKLLLVLDQNLFNAATFEIDEERDSSDYLPQPVTVKDYYDVTRRTINEFGTGNVDILRILSADGTKTGMSAVLNSAGFYSDGSYSNAADVHAENEATSDENTPPENIQDVLWRMENNTNHFEHSADVSEEALAELDKLLGFCAENNIEVTAFLPPYAPTVYAQLQSSGNFSYMAKIYPAILPIFNKYNYEIFDYSNLEETTDEMYIDGFHGSDRVYALVCAKLAVQSENFEQLFNEEYLHNLFKAPGNPLTVDF